MASQSWSRAELLHAMRKRRRLAIVAPGFHGRIVDVRDDGIVVVASEPSGSAYVHVASILTPPPVRFTAGHRVSTPFGAAVVLAYRATDDCVDYAVEFPDKILATGKPVLGFVAADEVHERADVVFSEALDAAAAARERGNRAFKERDFRAAVSSYDDSFVALQQFLARGVVLSAAHKESLREAFVKVMANKAQAHLSLAVELDAASTAGGGSSSPVVEVAADGVEAGAAGGAAGDSGDATTVAAVLAQEAKINFMRCVRAVDEALELDAANLFKQRDKCLYRRGAARLALGDVEAAIEDMKGLTDAAGRAKLAEARAEAKRLRDKERSMWGGAFARSAAAGEGDAPPPPSPLPSPSVREAELASPTKADAAVSDEPDGWGAAAAAAPQPKAAARTPHPKSRRDGGAASAAAGSGGDDAGATATATIVRDADDDAATSLADYLPAVALGTAALAVAGLGLYAFLKSRR